MINCRIADLNVGFDSTYEVLPIKLQKYRADYEKPDLIIFTTQKDIDRERQIDTEMSPNKKDYSIEINAALRKFAEEMPKYDGLLMHACTFETEGRGIAFAARSGTGKTTHMLLWQKLLGDKLTVVNGDKPIVRFADGGLYVYGTPWAGKEGMHSNIKAPLTDVCCIKRSPTNSAKRINKEEGYMILLNQIYMPNDAQMRIKTLELADRIANSVNFWEISCNMDIQAAQVSYSTIFKNEL